MFSLRRRSAVVASLTVAAAALGVAPAASAAPHVDVMRDTRPHPVITSISVSTGHAAGGDLIDVYGRNLTSVDGVMFGAVPSPSMRVLSPSRLRARAPRHAAGLVDIRLEQSNWLSPPTTADRFGYVATSPDPTFSASRLVAPRHDARLVMSCPTATFCGVAESQTLFTLVNGQKQPATSVPDGQAIDAIDCAAVGRCVAIGHVGNVAAVLSNGEWTFAAPLPATTNTWRLSCGSETSCWALEPGGHRVGWNGQEWTADPVTADRYYGVSCVSSSFCVAVGDEVDAIWDGTVWTPHSLTDFSAASVSCTSVTSCTAVGGGVPWRFDGASWSLDNAGSFPASPALLACSGAEFCLAVRPATGLPSSTPAWVRDSAGWRAIDDLGAGQIAQSVTCWGEGSCAVGLNGRYATLSGAAWTTSDRLDLSTGGIASVSCPATSGCAAVDDRGNVLSEAGGTWTAPAVPNGADYVTGPLVCVAVASCYARDVSGDPVHFDGTAWTPKAFVPASYGPSTVQTCVGPTFCLATLAGGVLVWNATTWAPVTLPRNVTPNFADIDCPAIGTCFLQASAGGLYVLRGADWTGALAPNAAQSYAALACPTTGFCLATSASGANRVWRYGHWTATPAGVNAGSGSADCRAADDCLVGSTTGAVYHWNGWAWKLALPAPALVSNGPEVITHRGTTWIVTYYDGRVSEGS